MLKMHGVNSEYVPEVAKDLAWEQTLRVFYDQYWIGAEQHKRLYRLKDKVDVIVTDSPLRQQNIYCNDPLFGSLMDGLASKYDNMNFFINRKKDFNPAGRAHDLTQAIEIDNKLKDYLVSNNIGFIEVDGTVEGYSRILQLVLESLGKKQEIFIK